MTKEEVSYKVHVRSVSVGMLDCWERWVDEAYEAGEMMKRFTDGRPYEVEVSIMPGRVENLFNVVKESKLRVEVIVFESEIDRLRYLEIRGNELGN